MKKKLLSFIVAIMLAATIVSPAMAAVFSGCEFESFNASVSSIETNKSEVVCFTAVLLVGHVSEIEVVTTIGESVAYLYDNGKNGDITAGDGIYSGETSLIKHSRETVGYVAVAGGVFSGVCEILFYNKVTDVDMQRHDGVWDKINDIENAAVQTRDSNSIILEKVFEYLCSEPQVAKVWYETDNIINFELNSGIGNIYTRFSDDTKANSDNMLQQTDALLLRDAQESYDYIDSGNIGVWSPYYGIDSSFSLNYLQRAQKCLDTVDGEIGSFYGAEATYESFKTWDEYGIIMVDSHGSMYSGNSAICVPRPGTYDSVDLAEGHIYSMGGGEIAITGSFFVKYCPNMPNSVVYLGICLGMTTTALSDPLLEAGAGVVIGYDESVSFSYDGKMLDSIFQTLCETNPESGSLYTVSEACEIAKVINGAIDPGSSHARLVWSGNGNITIDSKARPVEDFVIEPSVVELYINNTFTLLPVVQPVDASRYLVSWESSDSSVVSVDTAGCVTAHKTGDAIITCTILNDDGTTISKTREVNVLGSMPVSGVAFEKGLSTIYIGTENTVLEVEVFPENASNKNIIWASSDEEVAEVTQNGELIPKSEGSVVITAETQDGGYKSARIFCIVEPSINMAANKRHMSLEFENDSDAPWLVDIENEKRASLVSDVSGQSRAKTAVKLYAGQLEEGDVLSFDWKTSSESGYDKLTFYSNGTKTSVISGDNDWETYEYVVSEAGEYVFSWEYAKDHSNDEGMDCAWIDEIGITQIENAGETVAIRFIDYDGTVMFEREAPVNSEIEPPCYPYREGYTFIGWDAEGITGIDIDVHAMYAEGENIDKQGLFAVTFADETGNIVSRVYVEGGNDAPVPNSEYLNLVFAPRLFFGWDVEAVNILSDTIVTGIFAVHGDANGDNKVNTGDAAFILQAILDASMVTPRIKLIADINNDGNLNTGDAAFILQSAVGA